jgi:hypothetical protein
MDEFFDEYDDFGDENDGEESINDSFDDELEYWDDSDEDETSDQAEDEPDDLHNPPECESDDFTWKDAVILGGAMGWAYEEGFQDAIKRRQFRKAKKR